jgi:hypothetical protein
MLSLSEYEHIALTTRLPFDKHVLSWAEGPGTNGGECWAR